MFDYDPDSNPLSFSLGLAIDKILTGYRRYPQQI